jgi:hypothetical protein
MAQRCGPQPGAEAPGVAIGELAVDQQGEPVGVGEIVDAVLGLQLGEGRGHAVQPERAQLVEGRVGEHGVSFSGSSRRRGCWDA